MISEQANRSPSYLQENRPLSAPKISTALFKEKIHFHINNPFRYRISISWFGGVQIHPKFK